MCNPSPHGFESQCRQIHSPFQHPPQVPPKPWKDGRMNTSVIKWGHLILVMNHFARYFKVGYQSSLPTHCFNKLLALQHKRQNGCKPSTEPWCFVFGRFHQQLGLSLSTLLCIRTFTDVSIKWLFNIFSFQHIPDRGKSEAVLRKGTH